MQEEFEKRNHTWAEEEVRVWKKRQIKVGGREKKSISQTGDKNIATERGFTEKKGRMPLYNLECLYSNRRSELCGPKNAAISALSHPPLLG